MYLYIFIYFVIIDFIFCNTSPRIDRAHKVHQKNLSHALLLMAESSEMDRQSMVTVIALNKHISY